MRRDPEQGVSASAAGSTKADHNKARLKSEETYREMIQPPKKIASVGKLKHVREQDCRSSTLKLFD
jgi:hypothetical protein